MSRKDRESRPSERRDDARFANVAYGPDRSGGRMSEPTEYVQRGRGQHAIQGKGAHGVAARSLEGIFFYTLLFIRVVFRNPHLINLIELINKFNNLQNVIKM